MSQQATAIANHSLEHFSTGVQGARLKNRFNVGPTGIPATVEVIATALCQTVDLPHQTLKSSSLWACVT